MEWNVIKLKEPALSNLILLNNRVDRFSNFIFSENVKLTGNKYITLV
jgi:hypothetical protein